MIANGGDSSPNLEELDAIATELGSTLASSASKVASLLGYQISLFELFKYESKRYDTLGYCDFAIAYVSHSTNLVLSQYSVKLATGDTKSILAQILGQLKNNEAKYLTMKENLRAKPANSQATDPLALRFANLKLGYTEPSRSVFDGFRYSDSISVYELNHLIRSKPEEILLIDFRSQREFNYSHINFLNVINIPPSSINLLNQDRQDHVDEDLIEALREVVLDDEIQKFKERQKFSLIVIYNLRFGGIGNDKFKSLEYLLINNDNRGIPSSNPFKELLQLAMYNTKYLSSRPKQFPVFLNGGLERWYNVFGEGSLTRLVMKLHLQEKSDSSITESNVSKNPNYLTSFGDYFASAKSTPPIDKKTRLGTSLINESYRRSPSQNSTSGEKSRSSYVLPKPVEHFSKPSFENNVPPPQRPPPKIERTASATQHTEALPVVKTRATTPSKGTDSDFLNTFTTGLTNLGNSCYMNCVLQCLGATPQLTSFFFPALSGDGDHQTLQSYKQHINTKNKLGTSGVLTTNFVKLLGNMFNNVGKYFAPHDFKKIMKSFASGEHFASFDQQDCIEFLNFILDSLHEDLNQRVVNSAEERSAIMDLTPEQEQTRELLPVRLASTIEWERYLKLNFSIIVDYFQGQYLSQLKCLECGMTSTTYNAYSILSLPIPEKYNSSPVSLSDCLDLFTDTELLDEDNKWHCPRCQRFTGLTKKITITRFPKILIVHFKRFLMLMTGQFSKLDTFVRFPVTETLDLTSYWPPVGTYARSGKTEIDVQQEKKLLGSFPQRNQSPPFNYKLYGVVNHYGNLTNGHYTAYAKKTSDSKKRKEWCYFDDAKVTFDCKPDQVMNKNAYCLFFQRI